MRLLVIGLWCAWAGLAAEMAVAAGNPACKPGSFVLIGTGRGDVRGKADSAFRVTLDSTHYQNNGFDQSLRSALAAWSEVKDSGWRFQVAGYDPGVYPEDGRLSIVRGGGFSYPEGVLAVTLISWLVENGQIVDSGIYFNPGEPIDNTPARSEYDFEHIALHEMGHALGLGHNDDCVATPTIMNSTVDSGAKKPVLFDAEMHGVRHLYGRSPGGVAASPLELKLSGEEAGAPPPSHTLALTGAAGTNWSASVRTASGRPWLQVSAASGTTPANLTVRASTEGLASGWHSGAIIVKSDELTLPLPVTLLVSVPALRLSPPVLRFGAVAGGPNPEAQILSLVGTGGVAWNAASSAPWLRVATNTGALPATLAISVSPEGLAPRSYSGTIRVGTAAATREMAVEFEVAAQGRIALEPAAVSLSALAGALMPACAPVRISSFGNAPVDWTAASDAAWLAVLPASGRAPGVATVCAAAERLGEGRQTGSVTFLAASPLAPQTVAVAFAVTSAPVLTSAGVVSAATFASNRPIAPGQMITLFGTNLSSETAAAAGFPLPTELGQTRVLVGGVAAPLLYVSPGQINLVAPASLGGMAGSGTTVSLYNGRLAAPLARVSVARQAPGVFTALGNGAGAGAITHPDGSLVSRSNPLRPGETVSVYLTGIGQLEPPVPDGLAAPSQPLARATGNVRLLIDGQPAEVLFAGASPGFAGLHVVVAAVPGALRRRFPEAVVEVQGAASNKVTAGGPSLLEALPSTVRAGSDATVTLRGLNLPASSVVRVSGESLAAALSTGDLQSLRVTIPARLVATPGRLSLAVLDPEAPEEAASNAVWVSVER